MYHYPFLHFCLGTAAALFARRFSLFLRELAEIAVKLLDEIAENLAGVANTKGRASAKFAVLA